MTVTVIEANQFIDPKERIVESARLLASETVERLRNAEKLEISFRGLTGVSSSYFNSLLLTIAEAYGVDSLKNRVLFQFQSNAQRQIFHRSYQAVINSLQEK